MSNAHFTTHHVLTSMSKLNWCSLSFENEENRKNFILEFLDHNPCPAQYEKQKNILKIWISHYLEQIIDHIHCNIKFSKYHFGYSIHDGCR